MHTIKVPDRRLPVLSSSLAACIACILELKASAVPAPPAGHPEPRTVWRNWLGERGMGLVPVLAPQSFGWPGPWVGLLRARQRRSGCRSGVRHPAGARMESTG